MITETPRLKIREITVDDAAFVLELTNDPIVIANIGDKGLRSLADAERFIMEGPWTFQQEPGYGQFVVELKEECIPLGVCGILFREHLKLTDVGFAFLPQYRRLGYAFEAADAVMRYGHSVLCVANIVGLTSQSNPASIKLLEKLGLRFQKTIRMSDDDPGTSVYS